MSKIPEGAETATGEGRDMQSAVSAAAESLGVKKHQVHHTLDMSHFRNAEGRSTSRDTVKVIAWVNADAPEEAPAEPVRAPRPERAERDEGERRPRRDRDEGRGRERGGRDRGQREDRGRDRGDREDRGRGRERGGRDRDDRGRGRERGGRDRDDRGPEREERKARSSEPMGEPTEASEFAKGWFETLIAALRVEGTVEAAGTDDRVHIRIKPTSKAGRLIGRRGSTLAAIRHLLSLSVDKFGEFVIDVDVDDDREDRKPRERNDDRGEGRGRGRDRDRGDGRGRGRGRGRRDDDRGEREQSAYPEDKLKALARRAAEKAVETQKTITINLDLNSYDRRIVHLEVSECDGVATQSVEKDGKKVVQVIPE
ncbi:MAG: KH domain-containing protein [Myxococcota bacterium]